MMAWTTTLSQVSKASLYSIPAQRPSTEIELARVTDRVSAISF